MTAIPAWVDDYIGIPFASEGASREGSNCFGLVRLVMQERAGVTLPAYGALSADTVLAAARAFKRGQALPPWQPIVRREDAETSFWFLRRARSVIRPLDVVLMKTRVRAPAERFVAFDGHIGIMVTPHRMLHVEVDCDSVAVTLDEPGVREIISGFYRHEALA